MPSPSGEHGLHVVALYRQYVILYSQFSLSENYLHFHLRRCYGVCRRALQIFFYSKSIFKGAKIPAQYVPFAVVGTNAVNVLMTFVAVLSTFPVNITAAFTYSPILTGIKLYACIVHEGYTISHVRLV